MNRTTSTFGKTLATLMATGMLLLFLSTAWAALPTGDFDLDKDADGSDLFKLGQNLSGGSLDPADIEIFTINFGLPQITHARSISQWEITWTFDQPTRFGQFANEDFWVLGPVTIIAIDPASVTVEGRVMNGSMLDPSPQSGSNQGYDSSMYAGYGPYYQDELNAARPGGKDLSRNNPLFIASAHCLVSAISKPEAGVRPQLQTAAVLTILPQVPLSNSFRPAYSGSDKTIRFHVDQMRMDLLANLAPVSSTPDMVSVLNWFARPFLDHVPNWMSDYHHPEDNLPYYGRDISARIGDGALVLQLDLPVEQKQTLLIRYLQVGIDFYGVLMDGGQENWVPDGGHSSGRKWPILFAGLILGDAAMQAVGPGDGTGLGWFGEDAQTFYVTQADVDREHTPDLRNCYYEPYEPEDISLPEWGIRHGTDPLADNKAWCAIYRQCCTANAWPGFVLAARIMGAKELWGHDVLFDYQDRYMAIQTPGTWQRSWSRFSEEMWETYRDQY
jgi:hypothetical protein